MHVEAALNEYCPEEHRFGHSAVRPNEALYRPARQSVQTVEAVRVV